MLLAEVGISVLIICKFSNKWTCTRKKEVEGLSCGFEVKDALEKYFEATGANRSCGNDKETILLGRRIAAQRIVIDSIHLLNKYELYKIDNEIDNLINSHTLKDKRHFR